MTGTCKEHTFHFCQLRSVKNDLYQVYDKCDVQREVTTSGVTGGGQGGQSAPQRLLTGKFLLTYREKRSKEKREKG